MKKAINFVGFQAAWTAAVFGAARGNDWIGPLVVLIWLAVHIFLTGRPKREIRIALTALGLGLLTESLMIGIGAYTLQGFVRAGILPPLWLLALWINFGTLVNGSLSWLKSRYGMGAFLGFWGGPAAYYSGHRLGALTFHPPLTTHLVLTAIVWAAAVPLLFFLAGKFEN